MIITEHQLGAKIPIVSILQICFYLLSTAVQRWMVLIILNLKVRKLRLREIKSFV